MNEQIRMALKSMSTLHRIGLGIVLAAFALRVALHFDYTPDDTYIYLQYARNVIQHHEVSFNAGEPSYGITSPLWLGMISIAGWVGADLYSAAKTLDAVVALLALLALYRLQFTLTGNHGIALATTAVFSSHIWFLRWASSGMETSLATLLTILTVHSLLTQRYQLFAVCSAFLALTRPEAAGLAAVGLIASLYLHDHRTARPKVLLMVGVEFLAVLLPWLGYAYAEFGTVVPNTALAKSAMGFSWDGAVSTAVDFGKTLGVSDGPEMMILLVVLGVYVVSKRRHRNVHEYHNGESSNLRSPMQPFVIPVCWIVFLPMIYIVTSANVVSRYLLLISPMLILLVFAIPFAVVKLGPGMRHLGFVAPSLAAILLTYHVVVFETQVKRPIAIFSEGMNDCFIYIGRWLNQNTPRDSSVLVGDVGAIGYYSERKICDAAGLVSPELLQFSRLGYSLQRIMHEEIYRATCNASYVVDRSNIPNAAHDPLLLPLLTRPIYSLSLSSADTVYYTVYRVAAH